MQGKSIDPGQVYNQSVDKQRIVIAGSQSLGIAAMVVFVLKAFNREFDYIVEKPVNGMTSAAHITDAPIIVIQDGAKPSSSLLAYHHHMAVISPVEAADELVVSQFADATPKGGILIYAESGTAEKVGKKERPDTLHIPYKTYPHVMEGGQVALISSTNGRIPVKFSGEKNLLNARAAREILKKLGITSQQFYSAIARFEG